MMTGPPASSRDSVEPEPEESTNGKAKGRGKGKGRGKNKGKAADGSEPVLETPRVKTATQEAKQVSRYSF